MQITNETLDDFLTDFDDAVRKLEEKYDVTITLGRITYTENDFTAKMTVNNSRSLETIAENEFDKEVWKYADIGLKKGMYRQMFIARNGQKYAILGFIPNAKKYPLHVVRFSDGQHFKVPETFIKEILPAKYIENQK